ncbi:unnamed protein product [Clonostachys rosea f. rosea IK726]|nr:unnamed protein product [Clonostachys rosea f. rosea IK726]
MAQEDRFVLGMWIYEFQNLDQFTHYLIRMCSPGPPTELEQIIVFAGLFWLFCECSSLVEDVNVKKDYEEQAFLCRDNLETVLLNIRFHVGSNMDLVYAMSMAATYCLQISKISMAWMFICTAVHSAQTLGYHSAVPLQPESNEKKSQTTWLFWAIYSTERLLALRIGRSSNVRDQDITIPPVQASNSCDTYLRAVFPTWIKIAQIQGSLYDDLYSPGSLSKSEHSRVSRAYELAAEIKKIMDIETEVQRRFIEAWGQNQPRGPNSLIWKIDRVINLSTLTLVYRSIKPNAPGRSISDECLEVARAAMSELSTTLVLFSREAKNSIGASLHVNWSLVQAPFVPFTTLFCHVIETSEASDLEYLRDCIDSIQSMVACVVDAAPKNYLRLFRALYDAAVRYLDARSKSDQTSGQTTLSSPWASENPMNATEATQGSGIVPFTLPQFPQPDSGDYHQAPSSIVPTSTLESQEQLSLGLFGAGVDPQSSNLGSWYYNHHQLMRMLDDM